MDAHQAGGDLRLHHFSFDRPGGAVVAGVTERGGGVSGGPYASLNLGLHVGDADEHVLENRRRLCAALDTDLAALTMARQVHGSTVLVVDGRHRGRGARSGTVTAGDADALVTATPGILLAVLVADCVPVLIHDPVRGVVAVVHAGWRGTVARIVAGTVRTMVAQFGTDPADVVAAIGPSIGPQSYEVGPEVVAAARHEFPAGVVRAQPGQGGQGMFDLWAANRHLLVDAGVPEPNIEMAGIDTRRATDAFFSDRAQRPCGRFCAFGMLTGARR